MRLKSRKGEEGQPQSPGRDEKEQGSSQDKLEALGEASRSHFRAQGIGSHSWLGHVSARISAIQEGSGALAFCLRHL